MLTGRLGRRLTKSGGEIEAILIKFMKGINKEWLKELRRPNGTEACAMDTHSSFFLTTTFLASTCFFAQYSFLWCPELSLHGGV